jgi:hypothetical protein
LDGYKLKVKIGPNEFEAEGPQESVEKQFLAWSELISKSNAAPNQNQIRQAQGVTPLPPALDPNPDEATVLVGKIARNDGKVLSLTALPGGDDREGESALLILLGHKVLRSSDLVSGDDLLNGLKQTGFSGTERADRIAGRLERQGLITRTGVRRGVKYRLTNPGFTRAWDLARQLAGTVA